MILRTLAAGAALAASAAAAQDFTALAAREIAGVVPLERGRLGLTSEEPGGFAFYGPDAKTPQEVRCERIASFGFIAMANIAGAMRVGTCEREAGRVRALASDAKRGLDSLIRQLAQPGARIDPAMLEKAGWNYRRVDAPDGEEHYFPVLLIGHGILGPQTLVFVPKGAARAVVVQADVQRLCEGYNLEANPLCKDMRGTFARIARRIAALK